MDKKIIAKKVIYQILGLFLFGFGVAGMTISGAGASPLDAATNYIWVLTGIFTQGTWLFIFNVIFSFIVFMFTKKYKVFITLVMSLIVSLFINLGFTAILAILPNINFIENHETIFSVYALTSNGLKFSGILFSYSVAILSLITLACGIGLILAKDLYLTPFDELSLLIETKIGNYALSKSLLDGTALLVAIILGLLIKQVFSQLNVFSVIVVFTLGPLIGLFRKLFLKKENINVIE